MEKGTKTHQTRWVSLDPVTVAMVARHLAEMDERAIGAGAQVAGDAFVFSLGGKEGLPNVRVGNLHRVPRALFEQHYGITVTHIPPPTPAGRRRDPAASTPVRDLDTARYEPRPGTRKGRRTPSRKASSSPGDRRCAELLDGLH